MFVLSYSYFGNGSHLFEVLGVSESYERLVALRDEITRDSQNYAEHITRFREDGARRIREYCSEQKDAMYCVLAGEDENSHIDKLAAHPHLFQSDFQQMLGRYFDFDRLTKPMLRLEDTPPAPTPYYRQEKQYDGDVVVRHGEFRIEEVPLLAP